MTIGADLAQMIDRAAAITGSYGRTRQHVERIDAAAHALLAIELAHQEMDGFIRFAYKKNERNYFINIKQDGQIPSGVWTPWGCKSVLTRSQRDTLREWVRTRKIPRPPFYYVSTRYRWYIDLKRYESEADALKWLSDNQITINEWLNVQSTVQNHAA